MKFKMQDQQNQRIARISSSHLIIGGILPSITTWSGPTITGASPLGSRMLSPRQAEEPQALQKQTGA